MIQLGDYVRVDISINIPPYWRVYIWSKEEDKWLRANEVEYQTEDEAVAFANSLL